MEFRSHCRKKNIAAPSSRVHGCISGTTSGDKKWLNTSSKLESITAKFWMPKSSVPYRKLQANYFLTKHFWPRRRLIFSTLPSVVVIIFMKMEIWSYQFVMWPTWVYVTSRFGASRGKLTPCLVSWSNTTTNGGITYPVCGVTSQDHVTKESYDFIAGSS